MGSLTKLASNSFLVLGRAGMDLYPDPPGTGIEQATRFVSHLGGSSANIAAGLCRHGAAASLVTCVSDDAIGRFALNQLDHYGIDREFVRGVGGEFRNSLALSESRLEGHQTVIYRNGAADFQMSLEDVERPDYSNYSALITTGTVLAAEPSRSAAFHAFERARAAGIPLIFDVDYRPYSWESAQEASQVYSRAGEMSDIIIGNDDEFGFMAGGYDKGLAMAKSLAAGGERIAIYKMGENGSVTFSQAGEFKTSIYPVDALKPVGAGDAFLAGFVASATAGHDLQTCVSRGAASAAIVVTRVGCAPAMPTTQELDIFIASHPGPSTN